jgi:hypothetical protein
LVSSRQLHGVEVLDVDERFDPAAPLVAADIQMTSRPGWLLSLRFADCVPVLLVDPLRRVIAAVHAGWRGTLKGASAIAVKALGERYGCRPRDLLVGIGPSIGPCCYEVGEEVASQFGAQAAAILRNGQPRPHLDLWELNRSTLLRQGLVVEQIELARICTRCRSDLFFSHRAQGYPTGRFSAAIGLQ